MIKLGNISSVVFNKLSFVDVIAGGAHTALLAMNLASSMAPCNILLEEDSLSTILAITRANLILKWIIAPIIEDILSKLAPCISIISPNF